MNDPPRPAIRATDADREHTVGRLSDASVNGALTLEELADRADLAHRARTREELAVLIRDLPSADVHALYVAERREWAVCSHLTRGGRWLPAERNRYVSVCGTIDIDLREAVLHGPVIDLEVVSWFGTTTVLVPEGAVVELDAGGFSATHDLRVDGAPAPGAPVVRLRTRGGFGTVRVRTQPRRRDALKAAVLGFLGR
jgi:hypothetical protein